MADPIPSTIPLADEGPPPDNSANPTDADLRAICDPDIELCKEIGVPFANTIELDYATPNMYIGILSIFEFLVPYFL